MQDSPLHTSLQEAQPLVTFVVCYYDLPMQMLCQCVDSILALSLQHDEREIIVVDDGSDINPSGNALIKITIGSADSWLYTYNDLANMVDKGF